jgi:hypothetical protein
MTVPDMPEWLKDIGQLGLPEISNRDAASMLLPDLDYDAQLIAIHNALMLHRDANAQLENELKQLEEYARSTSGFRSERAVDEWVDRLHGSVYRDAAHSMAAVGMIAPLVESVFYQAFQNIRQQFFVEDTPHQAHARWELSAKDRWDCHYAWNNGRRSRNLVDGVIQLADATGLTPHLPRDLQPLLQALFEYRNKMFHCGFEWPIEERARFERRIAQSGWPADWFTRVTSGGSPWVFYLTAALIRRCLEIMEEIIDGMGAFVRQQLAVRNETVIPGPHSQL